MPEAIQAAKSHHTIALDENKRHFVFGDIHGRYATFHRLLELIRYDTSTDVIYSVGDLIDRGPDSASVVEFFQQPHCHSILGNHEQMVRNPSDWVPVWMNPWNGGPATCRSLEKQGYDRDWLERFCHGLPICLDVGDESQESSFRLIHAECPLDWSDSELLHYLSGSAQREIAEERLLWGRTDIANVIDCLESGNDESLSVADERSSRAVFCGHTPVIDVVSAFNVHWIDTFEGGFMTCMDPVAMKVYQQPIDTSDGLLVW